METGFGLRRFRDPFDGNDDSLQLGTFVQGAPHGRHIRVAKKQVAVVHTEYLFGQECGLSTNVQLNRPTGGGPVVVSAVQYSGVACGGGMGTGSNTLVRSSDDLKVLLRRRSLANRAWEGSIVLPEAPTQRVWFVVSLTMESGPSVEPHVHRGYGLYVSPDRCSLAGPNPGAAPGGYRPETVTPDTAHFEVKVWTRRSGRVVYLLVPRAAGSAGPVGPPTGGVDPRLPWGTGGQCVAIDGEFRTVLGSAFSGLRGEAALMPAAKGLALSTAIKETAPMVPATPDPEVTTLRLEVWQVPTPGFHRHWLVDVHQVVVSAGVHLAHDLTVGLAPDVAETDHADTLAQPLFRGGLVVEAATAQALAAPDAPLQVLTRAAQVDGGGGGSANPATGFSHGAVLAYPVVPDSVEARLEGGAPAVALLRDLRRDFLADLASPAPRLQGVWDAVSSALLVMNPERGLRARRQQSKFPGVERCFYAALVHHGHPDLWLYVAQMASWAPGPSRAGHGAVWDAAGSALATGGDVQGLGTLASHAWRAVQRLRTWLLSVKSEQYVPL